MPSESCPHCGKTVKGLKQHLNYCPQKPLESITGTDPEAEFEAQAVKAETIEATRQVMGRPRPLLPRKHRQDETPVSVTDAWYLLPAGVLPEDAFDTCSSWSEDQKAQYRSWGFIEVTPSKSYLIKRDGLTRDRIVILDPPPKERWRRIVEVLEKRRTPILEAETVRLEDEKSLLEDALGGTERREQRHRIRNCQARIDALSKPIDSDRLYGFFEAEARASRKGLESGENQLSRMVEKAVNEIFEGDDPT